MAENSGIAWTTHTFNPWVGCTKVSPGCDHCYAEAWDARFDPDHVARHWGAGAARRRTKPANWSRVERWQRERRAALGRGENPPPVRVFVASLADVFDNEVPSPWRSDLWELIARCPDLEFLLVTKRIGNVAKMAPVVGFGSNVVLLASITSQAEAYRDLWKLCAVEDHGIARRIGVSYEPALGLVDWSTWIARLDWLIVGGESAQKGAAGRLFDADWARIAILQGRYSSVPVFTKQLGARCILSARDAAPLIAAGHGWERIGDRLQEPHGIVTFRDGAGADPDLWPSDLRVREFVRGGLLGG